jgi:hypothetical protein
MFMRGDMVKDRLNGQYGMVTGTLYGSVIVAWESRVTKLVKPIEIQLVEHSVII